MGHSIKLSVEQVEYLKQNHLKTSYADMSRKLGVCADTLKRMLVRLELQEFNGAKYHHRQKPKTWKRPCMKCKCTKPRPINQYICTSCTTGEDINFFEDELNEVYSSKASKDRLNKRDVSLHYGHHFGTATFK